MNQGLALTCRHNERIKIADLPTIPFDLFADLIVDSVSDEERLVALFAQPHRDEHRLFALLTNREEGALRMLSAEVRQVYPSLTPQCPQAHWFEREIWERWALTPIGHPRLKPIRFTASPIGVTDFFRINGDDIHEVAVGPVHAGVIEPGHFRFSCLGETVHHLEISLGYQHRGVEEALLQGSNRRTIHHMETLAGDTSVGHATAYCQNIEALSQCRVPYRGMTLRGVSLELERLANHIGDLGALAGDVGYLPAAAHCGRIRGDILNLTAMICGNRLGRRLIRPGGVAFDLNAAQVEKLLERLETALQDITTAAQLIWETPSVINRFEGVGRLSGQQCRDLGIVGVAARAAGLELDTRQDFPSDVYRFAQIPVSLWQTGDVFGRAYVRWLEIRRSAEFIQKQLATLSAEPVLGALGPLAADSLSIALVEGWRGEICHVACTGPDGQLAWYKVFDPSFHNWAGLALAMRNQQISDFPLCNKSFNLSYCGHDL